MVSFEEIYNDTSKLIYHLIFSYIHNEEDSKDILQDVYMAYLEKGRKIKAKEEVKFWLIRVAINKSINFLKNKSKKDVDISDAIVNNLLALEKNKESDDFLYLSICELDSIYKDVIILHYYDDIKTKDISKILKVKESTVRMRLMRARNILKEKMENYKNG